MAPPADRLADRSLRRCQRRVDDGAGRAIAALDDDAGQAADHDLGAADLVHAAARPVDVVQAKAHALHGPLELPDLRVDPALDVLAVLARQLDPCRPDVRRHDENLSLPARTTSRLSFCRMRGYCTCTER